MRCKVCCFLGQRRQRTLGLGRPEGTRHSDSRYGTNSAGMQDQQCRKAVATPSVIAKDGESAVIEFYHPEDAHRYKRDLDATSSKEKMTAESITAEKIRKALGRPD